jgi:hypothetical protein
VKSELILAFSSLRSLGRQLMFRLELIDEFHRRSFGNLNLHSTFTLKDCSKDFRVFPFWLSSWPTGLARYLIVHRSLFP